MSKENIEQQIDEAVGSIKEEQSWLLTYADMMTLLFAFFVLLFSMSTIDPVKISQLQDGMGDKPELKSFNEILQKRNTIIIIEHNMEVIKSSDWIIELGPEGGEKGGRLIFEGTPEEMRNKITNTSKELKSYLK